RYTFAHRDDLKLSFFSRSGTFKTIISKVDSIENQYITKENIESTKAENNDIIPLATYLDCFIKELKLQKLTLNRTLTAESHGTNKLMKRQIAKTCESDICQAVLKNITLLQTDIYYTLTEADKYLFLCKYYKTWGKLRAPFPPETGNNLVDAWG